MQRQTSIDAYKNLVYSGVLAKLNATVYAYIWNYGPITQKQVERALGDKTYSIRPRFKPLEDMGLICIVGKEPCEETRKSNLLYDVTDRIKPLDRFEKRISAKKLEVGLCQAFKLLDSSLFKDEQVEKFLNKWREKINL